MFIVYLKYLFYIVIISKFIMNVNINLTNKLHLF